ncbi:MAG: primosomal protein N' [Clostridiales bacterium]|nr:primosomal protein N' [Clostridiales bacterium]
MFAQVIVDIVHENVARTFSYRVPEGMQLSVGQRVEVPFARMIKEGVVVGFSDECDVPPEKLRDIRAPLEDYAAVLPQLLSLARRMAEDAHCPLAETLRLMLPAEMRGGRVNVKTQPVAQLAIPVSEVDAAIEKQGRSQKRRMLLNLLRDGEIHPVEELRILVRDPMEALHTLEEIGLVRLMKEEVLRRPTGDDCGKVIDPPLTAYQQEALDVVLPDLRAGQGKYLLHGVTGSGKTEVFIRLVRHVLAMGKSAIILVPEIALTPQMVSWFRARFGDTAAVLHSRLSAGERFDEWRRIRHGQAKVVIGARSAVFAPCEDLGIIVVDEEHETTYLSDRHPRYDARDVAAFRAENEGATLLLASATPSILSFAKARRGDYTLLEMPHRVNDRPMPQVTVVDMRREIESGNRSVFSGVLMQKLRDCMARGEQAMLLMNRRGYNSFVSCRSCGLTMKCPNCDVALTYHLSGGLHRTQGTSQASRRDSYESQTLVVPRHDLYGGDGRLHCHYCGYMTDTPTTCPDCASKYIRFFGAGTQKVEDELRKLLPGVTVARMDVDTTSGKEGHAKILDEFRSGRARILVGTQMIAKGLDFPKVTLVGVVAADMTLNLPDYRSRERTFQLLTQVAGRAGRGTIPGEVIVQTYKPEDEIIQASASQDYRAFFEMEFSRRRTGLYPPFTILARLLVESPSELYARKAAEALHTRCQALLEGHPAWKKRILMMLLDQPGVKVLRGKSRWHVMFKLLVNPATEEFVAALTEMAREPAEGAEVYFEYNPTTMM